MAMAFDNKALVPETVEAHPAQSHVRFTPNSDRESGFPQMVMSALPPKADTDCALDPNIILGRPVAALMTRIEHAPRLNQQ
jgi:hypothetical protein